MKLAKTALLLLLASTSATAASAFTPSTKAFGIQRSKKKTTQERTAALYSTTEFRKNNVSVGQNDEENDLFAKVLPTTTQRATTHAATKSLAKSYLSKYEGLNGAAILYSKLQEHGVSVVNGYSGGAVLPLLDQFHVDHPRNLAEPSKRVRWITNSNEGSAGYIAEGYAKSMPLDPENLPVSVCVATSGPGVTNLITPLQDAICDGVPVVAICGQAATVAPQDAFQSAPAVDLTRPCTKWSYQIKSAAEVPFVMDYAFFMARNGRPGPVFVDFPKDLQIQTLTQELMDEYTSALDSGNSDFASVVERQGFDGQSFSALRLGTPEKGLAFEFDSSLELTPAQQASSNQDLFHADHNPTNRIIYTEKDLRDETRSITREGDLSSASLVMKELVNRVKMAKRPIIIAGQGCNDCPQELQELAETLQIPVTTTLHALGTFDERSPLALNMMGMHGHPTPNFMVQECDLVLCIGSRFDDRITGRMSDFIPEARKAEREGRGGIVHVDIRLTERAKQVQPTYFVHSTGKSFLRAITEMLRTEDFSARRTTLPWIERMKELQNEYPVKIPQFDTEHITVNQDDGSSMTVPRTRMSAQLVVTELNKQLLQAGRMDDAIFTTGVGVHQMVTAQLITWTQPRQMLSSGSLGTMGVALGYCIGAKLANGNRMCIAVDGDGSFNMTFTELKTIVEQGNIPIKILVLDNESQMMVEYWQRLFQESRYLAVRNRNPDYSTLASAFGIKSLYCDAEEDLEDAMRQFLFDDPDQPVLFHARIERTPCLPLVAPGQALENMILEDETIDVDPSAAPS